MTRTRRLLPAALAIAVTVAIAGCAGTPSSGGAGSGSATSATASSGHRVVISGFAFHPSTLTVPAGSKVTFVNQDDTTHTATGSGSFDSGNLNHGQSYTYTFSKPGTYHYICNIHQYMHATVVVTAK
ncbi:MAG TPA: cupredoxin domain-containing protein [Mycobacteriales bacterium]|nr:cupredoxin domain-containing protein [Mycobacteriales bacterium]